MASLITVIVYSVLIAYVLGSALYFYGARSGKDKVLHSARMVTIVGFILNLLALITRTIIAGRLPLANSIEFMLWFAMITVVLYLIYERNLRPYSQPHKGQVLDCHHYPISASYYWFLNHL